MCLVHNWMAPYKHKVEIPLISMDDAKSCHEQFPPFFRSLLMRQCRDKQAECKLIKLIVIISFKALFTKRNSPKYLHSFIRLHYLRAMLQCCEVLPPLLQMSMLLPLSQPPQTQVQSPCLPTVRPSLPSASNWSARWFQMSSPAIAVVAAPHKQRPQTQTPKKGLGISASSLPLSSSGLSQSAHLIKLRL